MVNMAVTQWVAGLSFALFAGGIVVWLFLYPVRGFMGLGDKPKPKIKRVPPWLTGFVERFVFAILVGLDLPGAATAMMGWLAIKLASNWNRKDMEDVVAVRAFSFSALLAGLISMMFAALGGVIAGGKLWNEFIRNI